MSDTHGKQPVESLDAGDVLVGVLDDTVTRIDPRDIRALDDGTDTVTLVQPTAANLQATVVGTLEAINPIGTVGNLNATVAGTLEITNPIGTVADLNATVTGTVNAEQTTPADLKIEVSGQVLTDILAALGGGGSNLTKYQSLDLDKSGDPNDSLTTTALTVTSGKVLVMQSIVVGMTRACRFDVLIGPAASEVSKYVVFASETTPLFVLNCGGFEVADTDQVIITMTNLSNKATTGYSSINYFEKDA